MRRCLGTHFGKGDVQVSLAIQQQNKSEKTLIEIFLMGGVFHLECCHETVSSLRSSGPAFKILKAGDGKKYAADSP